MMDDAASAAFQALAQLYRVARAESGDARTEEWFTTISTALADLSPYPLDADLNKGGMKSWVKP